ncbi:ROK family protein [Lacticaseibacillus hegangensis]|uniref:ROK family protein n=1 Tax=Lacticaseibacillus hegangensis TaxID=2486010 RepID=A0ABW4CU98_9LACO|nr:ROK family protein [Lacticaseibacillus hegangensis]
MRQFLGVDLGGTSIKTGVVDENGQVTDHLSFKTPNSRDEIFSLINQRAESIADVRGVGISIPGYVSPNGLVRKAGALTSLAGLNIKSKLEEMLALPVSVENDANSFARAEAWQGVGRDKQNFIVTTVGTGVGSGIYIGGRLFRGTHDRSGETGYMVVADVVDDDTDLASINKKASIPGLLRYYEEHANHPAKDGEAVYQMANDGDFSAVKAVQRFTLEVSKGLYNLTVLFDPELLVIGGGISSNSQFLHEVQQRYQVLCTLNGSLSTDELPAIVPATFRNDGGMIGAVSMLVLGNGAR